MAEYEDDFDFDTDDFGSDGGSDLVKKLRKQVSDLSKQLREQEQTLDEYYEMSREQQIAEVLTESGINPKIAAFIPDDVENEDDLAEWLATYGEVFNISVTDNQDGGEENSSPIDPELIQAAELMSAAEEGSIDPAVGQDIANRIEGAGSADELLAMLRG